MEQITSIDDSTMLIKLQDRIGKLYLSKQWSDCVFKINSNCIYAHRVILASASPVFEVMLYGPLAEGNAINIYDISADTFMSMLCYIYTDKSTIESIESACNLLYASIKYMLHHLQGICKSYIMRNLSISNALEILDFALLVQNESLIEAGMQIVCAHTKYVFSETDYHPHASTMLEITKQETINISEIDLLDIINKWYSNECKIQDVEKSMESIQTILIDSGILDNIRFLSMNLNDFSKIQTIINYISNENLDKLMNNNSELKEVSAMPRKHVKLVWHYCICQYFKPSYPLWIDMNNTSTQVIIAANKTVLVNSFKVTSRLSPQVLQWPTGNLSNDYEENISIEITDNFQNVVAHREICTKAYFNDYLNIDLDEPIVFRSQEPYTIKFQWNTVNWSMVSAQYPQQFVSDIGSKNRILFSIRNGEVTFVCGITYSM